MIKLFHVSDVHFGVEDPAAHGWFKACVAREKPDAIALTGDITQRAKHSEFAAATRWIGALEAPVKVEIGNHDMPYYNPVERAFAPYRRFLTLQQAVERPIDLPGVSLVSLRSTSRAQWRTNWSRGIIRPAALAETLAAIAAVPKGDMVIVCTHHPLVETNTKGEVLTRHGEHALCALAKAGVTAILTGHVHDAFDLTHPTADGPIRMIGAGTLSRRVRSTPPSFNELKIDNGSINVCARNVAELDTAEVQIDDIPPDAEPPVPGDRVAPAAQLVGR
jgi:3',5'-cyclic AMP phosphodiesterase CpdA